MKVEKWYDIYCEFCHRYISSDFGCGMQPTRDLAISAAKRVGYKTKNGKTICPVCIEERDEK